MGAQHYPADGKGYWPLGQGRLPPELFPDEHLRAVLFEYLPLAHRCATAAIRQGIKAHLKKTAPATARPSGSDQLARDRQMAALFGNTSSARDRVGEISFVAEESFKQRGRGGTRSRVLQPANSFADMLWMGYRKAPDMVDLHQWLLGAGVERADFAGRTFLTAESLSTALASGTCPVETDNIWFARSVALFASLLPSEDCRDLLEVAARLGSLPLAAAYFADAVPEAIANKDKSKAACTGEAVGSAQPARPRLVIPEIGASNAYSASPEALRLRKELEGAEAAKRHARHAAEKALGHDAAAMLDGPAETWQAVVEAVETAHRTARTWEDIKQSARTYLDLQSEALDRMLGTTFTTTPAAWREEAITLAAELVELDELKTALQTLQPSADLIAGWRATIGDMGPTTACRTLVRAAEQEFVRRQSEEKFRTEVAAYGATQPTEEITAFLVGLDAGGLAALLPMLVEFRWVVGGAIVFRSLIDKGETNLSQVLSQVVQAPKPLRRALLRFIDPAASAYDGFPDFRRVVALERLQDIMAFGPLAQIGDPSSGLSDADLVGRSIYELVELVLSNLDILDAGIDIIRILRPPSNSADAAQRLIDHIQTPATLTGNFRRLREQARELLLLPLGEGSGLDVTLATALQAELASGQAMDLVLATFESERPDDRLENRHREQLARYLHQTELLLNDYLTEANKQPDARRKALAEELREIRARLRQSGEAGTIEWLEAEVGRMLDGIGSVLNHRTLVGGATPVADHEWLEDDRDWASEFVDLPEFYGAEPPRPLEVAASVLHWNAIGKLPSKRDIIDFLVERRAFREALRLARDVGDTVAQSSVSTAAQPVIGAIEGRARELVRKASANQFAGEFDQQALTAALDSLDVDAASDLLDVWELLILEQEEKRVASPCDSELDAKRQWLMTRLGAAGVEVLDERMSHGELEAIWQDLLTSRLAEREHLVEITSALEPVGAALPGFSAHLRAFVEHRDDPKYWLASPVASDFKVLVTEAIEKIATWIQNSPNFRAEEQSALTQLSKWFLDFVGERSLSLHQQDDPEVVQSGFDRLLEVADTIIQSQRPSECLDHLCESGELEAEPTTWSAEEGSHTPKLTDASDTPVAVVNMVQGRADQTVLPDKLTTALRCQNWSAAIEACELAATEADSIQAARFVAIARAIGSFCDQSAIPVAEVADMFPSSAAWLSNPLDGAGQIGESKRTDLAFQLLSGAIAADSEQAMPRKPGSGGSWSEILSRTSPFRRMLTAGVPSRTGRVLEALVSGPLGLAVAEKIWDAATNLGDPQAYRIPLLNFLYDAGSHEVIIKLAQRHETTIAPRLAQLFELRAVAINRPDLLPVSQSLAEHLAGQAKGAPFRTFVKNLPTASQTSQPTLQVSVDGSIQLRPTTVKVDAFELPIVVTPEGLVPAKLFARLFAEDDVSFADDSRFKELSAHPIYFATDFTISLRFGSSWFGTETGRRESLRIRIEAKTITEELVVEDAVCKVRPVDRGRASSRILNTDTLLDFYPGVANTPVVDDAFVGRFDETEQLHQVLVSSKNPSPVLLTGMRRVGKTSLLYAFHKRFSKVVGSGAISVYQTLAERRVELSSLEHTVASVFFKTVQHALVRPNLPADDRNYALCAKIRQYFNGDWKEARRAIQDCYDQESLSSSLIVLAERLREWTGSQARFVLLIDEAEALVASYQAGGRKRIELEQLLQSLREVSQTTASIGILLSGSNHINMFAREYKNAFFGSSQSIELEGFDDVETAAKIVAPKGIESFVQFDKDAIEYAWRLCAGMPQFLWQVGATTALQVRSGPASRSDIRAAVATLVGPDKAKLPFKAYEILEPIDSMLQLETSRERDLLWMLLYRVAQASSLAQQDAALPFVIDQALLAADDRLSWKKRLATLIDLKVLNMDSSASVSFRVPLFAEGYRAPKNWQEFNIRQQQVAV